MRLNTQENQRFRLDANYQLSIVHTPNSTVQNHVSNSGKYKIQALDASLSTVVFQNKNQLFSLGFNYQLQRMVLENYVTELQIFDPQNSIYTLSDPADVVSVSNQFGFLIDYRYNLFKGEKNIGYVGGSLKAGFFEFFNALLRSSDIQRADEVGNLPGIDFENTTRIARFGEFYYGFRELGFSSMQLNTYYVYPFINTKQLSCAAKFSLGTNLHSDWDQFRKFLWLGVGVEVGILSLKTKKQTNDK